MASTTRGEFERQRGELIREIAEVPSILPFFSHPNPYVLSYFISFRFMFLFF